MEKEIDKKAAEKKGQSKKQLQGSNIMKRKKIDEMTTEVTLQGFEFLLNYVSKLVDSVISRYGALSFLNNESADLQNDRNEIDKVLANESYAFEDRAIIAKLDEIENVMHDKISVKGYQKGSSDEQLIYNLSVVSNLNRKLKKLQAMRAEKKNEISTQEGEKKEPSIVDNLKTIQEKTELEELKESAMPQKSKTIIVRGEEDKKSAFSFDKFEESTENSVIRRFITTEEQVEILKSEFADDQKYNQEFKDNIEKVLSADLSTSFENGAFNREKGSCSPLTIARAAKNLGDRVERFTSSINYYEDKVKWAESVIRYSRKKKPADYEIVEMYQKFVDENKKHLSDCMSYGSRLDKKLAEVMKYRSENKAPEKPEEKDSIGIRLYSFNDASNLISFGENSSVAKKIAKDLMNEAYPELKQMLDTEIKKKGDKAEKGVEVEGLFKDNVVRKIEEHGENFTAITYETDDKKIKEIANNPATIINILDALRTGTYKDGRKLTREELHDLNTILNRVAFEKSMQEQLDSMKDNEKKDKAKKVEIPQEEGGMSM